ncbi:hypothetical protein OCV51_02730 [Faecalicatena acetigenes]|uniref:Uncharacterized protein n=1 Tax=Faecalicatena acetigenes TaxID=2981790 RepID=A0ABT2T8J0_9FIRM|nr:MULTISPECIES: hypothetical protein [Lachnospiraceae]MCU6746582.1 hypothetical protein [Faecalicatena acetigenes]SCH30458.1 Uncharacterised protein [uncultured Clostridium sp.]
MLECVNGRMKVSFVAKEVIFQYPQSFINGFLTCSEIDEMIFKRNGEILEEIESLKKKVKNAQMDLQQLQ